MGELYKSLKRVTQKELIDLGIEGLDLAGYGIEYCYNLFSDPKEILICLRKKLNKVEYLLRLCIQRSLNLRIKLKQVDEGSKEHEECIGFLETYDKLIPLINGDRILIKKKIKLQKAILEKEDETVTGMHGPDKNKQDEMKISKDQFIFLIKTLGEIDALSPITVKNADSIFDARFSDENKLCPNVNKYRIDFTTSWFNVRYIFEGLFRNWFKKEMTWKDFVDKHMLLKRKRVKANFKNTKEYKNMADEIVKGNVGYIRAYILKKPV